MPAQCSTDGKICAITNVYFTTTKIQEKNVEAKNRTVALFFKFLVHCDDYAIC